MRRVPHGHWRDRYPHVPTRAQARARVGLPADAAVFGFAASCRPYKNVESIVDAHRELDSASHLLIAGTFLPPEYLDTVRSRIDPACADRVHIVPRFLDAEELMAYVAALDVYVLSYKEILTSGAVMLAFSAGVPVVAPRIGGLPELIDARVGVLYDASVPGDLARALREVRQRTYSAETIIAHALSFDWRVSARALVDVVMGGAREPHATSVLQAKGAESKR
jgi:glycosyltransferase involved in cell wall biosynthesis